MHYSFHKVLVINMCFVNLTFGLIRCGAGLRGAGRAVREGLRGWSGRYRQGHGSLMPDFHKMC